MVLSFFPQLNGSDFGDASVYSGLASGTYYYVVRDSNMCDVEGFVEVMSPDSMFSREYLLCAALMQNFLVGSVTATITSIVDLRCYHDVNTGSLMIEPSLGSSPYSYSVCSLPLIGITCYLTLLFRLMV